MKSVKYMYSQYLNTGKKIPKFNVDLYNQNNRYREFRDSVVQLIEVHYRTAMFCKNNSYITLMATQLYKLIDNLTWLSNGGSTSKKKYVMFVNKYILPYIDDDLTAIDLYSSRCSVLHAHSYQSDLIKKFKALPVVVYTGDSSPSVYFPIISNSVGNNNIRILNADTLTRLLDSLVDLIVGDILNSNNRDKCIKLVGDMFLVTRSHDTSLEK